MLNENLKFNCMCNNTSTIDVFIGQPENLQHNIHVNKELDWRIRNPETSFKLEEKLGEGYAFKKAHC